MIRLFTIINSDDEIPVVFSIGATNLARGQVSLDRTQQIISGDFENPNTQAIENAGFEILTQEEARQQATAWDVA